MTGILVAPHFHDEKAAFTALENIIWPEGPICPKCGCMGRIGALVGRKDRKGRERLGVKKCYDCREQFTVRVGTIFESSHVPLHLWLQAIYLLSSSKKGMSANQFARILGLTRKSAWFVAHRVREAMASKSFKPMGGEGEVVEADETYFGKKSGGPRKLTVRGLPYKSKKFSERKNAIVSLVQRGGEVRSFHVEHADKVTVAGIVARNIAHDSRLHTDESPLYKGADGMFASHETVNHSAKEYARGDVNTNSAEGYFSIFKRGMKGVYQHCDEKHLHRYLAEFDFRYNHRVALGVDDTARAVQAIKGAVGKRLTYRTTGRYNGVTKAQSQAQA